MPHLGISSRATLLLDHDLSPLPLVTVFLGYWLPLDWMLRGWATMANSTILEKAQALGSSVLLTFLPVALGVALLVYLGSAFSLMTQARYSNTVRWFMYLAANFIALISTALAGKLLLMGEQTAPPLSKIIVLAIVTVLTYWLSARGRFLVQQMVLSRWLALALLPLAVAFVSQEALSQPSPSVAPLATAIPRAPNIILVTLDTCSSQSLSSYGYTRATTPHLDAIAQEGILFEQFYANANCTRPGIASLLNGARPWSHAGDLGRPRQGVTAEQNLLGCLARAGYDVRTVSSNNFADHAWQGTPIVPTGQALVVFRRSPHLVPPPRLRSSIFSARLGPMPWVSRLLDFSPTRDKVTYPLALAKQMLGNTSPGRPRFFWIHFLLPHDPYAAPDPYLGRFEPSPLAREPSTSGADYLFAAQRHPGRQRILKGRYDEGLLAVDCAIGDLMNWLKAQGTYDSSLIAFCADHGESFAHGYGAHGGPLLTEDLIRVPLIIKRPGQKTGERVVRPFEQADLAPTLLHLAGLPIPAGMEGQPYPLKPDGVPVFAMNRDLSSSGATFNLAMRQGPWKYVTHFGKWTHPWPQRELYNLEQDPNENNNLVDHRQDIAGPMHQRILEELAKRGLKPEAP